MSNVLDIKAARVLFADAIAKSGYVPESAKIKIRDEPELGEAAAFHCYWHLDEKGPFSGEYSREITVQITSQAMNSFREAGPVKRGEMIERFGYVFRTRLLDGQYNEQDPSHPPFIIKIDEHSLD